MSSVPSQNDWEDMETTDGDVSLPLGLISSAFLGLFAFIPLGWILRLCGLSAGVSLPGMKLALSLMGLFLLVSCVLVWPLTSIVYPQFKQSVSPVRKILISITLLTPPLVGFCYYWGSVKDWKDVLEIALIVLPSVIISSVVYDLTQRAWLLTLLLVLSTFVPIFLVNDILSPYPVRWVYYSSGVVFYYLRVLIPVGTALFCVWHRLWGRFAVAS